MAAIVTGVDTSAGYFEKSGGIPLAETFSVELCFTMPSAISTPNELFSFGSSPTTALRGYINSVRRLYVYYGNTSANTSLALSKKHHLVVAFDGNVMKLYLDGTFAAESSNITSKITNNLLLLGKGTNSTYVTFKGKLHTLRIFNRVLTDTDITDRYNAGNPEVWVEPNNSGCTAEFRAFTATAAAWEESRGNGLRLDAVGTVALETINAVVVSVPWGDGTGDVITVTYTGVDGESPMLISSNPNLSGAARSKIIELKDGGGIPRATLAVTQHSSAGGRAYSAAYNNSYK